MGMSSMVYIFSPFILEKPCIALTATISSEYKMDLDTGNNTYGNNNKSVRSQASVLIFD